MRQQRWLLGARALAQGVPRPLPATLTRHPPSAARSTNLAFASVQLNQDLHFNAAVYGQGSSIFFAGG